MAKVKAYLNEQVLTQLGLVLYQPKAGFFDAKEAVEEESANALEFNATVQMDEPAIPSPAKEVVQISSEILPENAKIPSPAIEEKPNEAEHVESATLEEVGAVVAALFLAEGLSAVWQKEASPEWRLWRNICRAFHWPVEVTQGVDLAALQTEAAIEQAFEQFLAQDIHQVLVTETALQHPLTQLLSEGFELLVVPSLTQMLQNALAKQQFYAAVVTHLEGRG
jgi:hypothetical protein